MRNRCQRPWRVYRPGIVVGHSQTGQIDKVDGPYYFFKLIQKLRQSLPPWFPLIGLEGGYINLVPVDYVVAAMDHLAHLPGHDGQCFHLTDPRQRRVGEVLNLFARAGHAPTMAFRLGPEARRPDPGGRHRLAVELPAAAAGDRHGLARPQDSARRHAVLQLADPLRLYAHAATARGQRGAGAGARGLRLEAVGLLGTPPRSGPVARPQSRGRRARQGGVDHRRVLRHRPGRRRALCRRGRARNHRRARPREAGGGAQPARRAGRQRPRHRLRHRGPARRATRWRSRCSPSMAASTSSSTMRAARYAARSNCPTTASTTSSAPCSSTTSPSCA